MEHVNPHASTEALSTQILAGKTILLADDEVKNRRIAMAYLLPYGVKFVEADHGLQVVALLDAGVAVDAILIDMQMPGLGGIQTAQVLQQNPKHRHIPIVALTAHFGDADIQQAHAAGIQDLMAKPVEASMLSQTLAAALTGAKALPEKAAADLLDLVPSACTTSEDTAPAPAAGPVVWTEEALQAKQANAHGALLLNLPLLDGACRSNYEAFMEYSAYCCETVVECLALLEKQWAQRSDFEAFYNTMHKLLGNVGGMGSCALHQYLKSRIYSKMAEDSQWPTEENWLAICKDLHAQTVAALKKSYWSAAAEPPACPDANTEV